MAPSTVALAVALAITPPEPDSDLVGKQHTSPRLRHSSSLNSLELPSHEVRPLKRPASDEPNGGIDDWEQEDNSIGSSPLRAKRQRVTDLEPPVDPGHPVGYYLSPSAPHDASSSHATLASEPNLARKRRRVTVSGVAGDRSIPPRPLHRTVLERVGGGYGADNRLPVSDAIPDTPTTFGAMDSPIVSPGFNLISPTVISRMEHQALIEQRKNGGELGNLTPSDAHSAGAQQATPAPPARTQSAPPRLTSSFPTHNPTMSPPQTTGPPALATPNIPKSLAATPAQTLAHSRAKLSNKLAIHIPSASNSLQGSGTGDTASLGARLGPHDIEAAIQRIPPAASRFDPAMARYSHPQPQPPHRAPTPPAYPPSTSQAPDHGHMTPRPARFTNAMTDDENYIGSLTPVPNIVSTLVKHGCADLTLSINLDTFGAFPVGYGGFCDVYKGEMWDGRTIAVKSLRVSDGPDADRLRAKIYKDAARELYRWSKLRHPNVLPLLGLTLFRGQVSMVSEWMSQGNLYEFLRCNQDANRIYLCMDVCAGLCYLHENGFVHGDLKAANVMVSPAGVAMIADFGNTQLKDISVRFSTTTRDSLSVRWAAPELLSDEGPCVVSKESDVWAYAMTILEVLTGKVPFDEMSERSVLVALMISNRRPSCPSANLPEGVWDILESCWAQSPAERPEITAVRDRIHALCPNYSLVARPPPLPLSK